MSPLFYVDLFFAKTIEPRRKPLFSSNYSSLDTVRFSGLFCTNKHLDLPVIDVTATQHFLINHFGFSCFYQRDDLVILKDEAGFVLTLSQLPIERMIFRAAFILALSWSEKTPCVKHTQDSSRLRWRLFIHSVN